MRTLRELMDLTGRKALLTGGAGHLGRACAEALLELGASVAILDQDPDACRARAEEFGPKAVLAALRSGRRGGDTRRHADRVAPARRTRHLGALRRLCRYYTNARMGGAVRAAGSRCMGCGVTRELDGGVRVGAGGAQAVGRVGPRLNHPVFVHLRCNRSGSWPVRRDIYGQPGWLRRVKGGVIATRAPSGDHVGAAYTSERDLPGGVWRGQPQAFHARYEARTPLKRMAVEEDVKGAVAYLASDLSAYVTGHNLLVDGAGQHGKTGARSASPGRPVGPGHPCFVIAEAGVNHNGDLDLARRLVDIAAEAGADAVKFQTFRAERLATSGAPKAEYQRRHTSTTESQLDMLRRLELTSDAHRELQARCHARNVLFLSTPFDEGSADFLESLDVPAFKIPSGEITNLSFVAHVARKRRPMIVSTGMAHLHEVEAIVRTVRETGNPDIVLLHCVSNYPAAPGDVNLRAMHTMAAAFGLPVGYSTIPRVSRSPWPQWRSGLASSRSTLRSIARYRGRIIKLLSSPAR